MSCNRLYLALNAFLHKYYSDVCANNFKNQIIMKRTKTLSKQAIPRASTNADVVIGKKIRTARVANRISQQSLATALGVSFQQVQKYENGMNRVTADRLKTIAQILGIDLGSFFSSFDETADTTKSMLQMIDKQTLRILKAYAGIKDRVTQQQMVVLAETIANRYDLI